MDRSFEAGRLVGVWLHEHHNSRKEKTKITVPGAEDYNQEAFFAGIEAGYAEAAEKEGSHGGQHQET